MKASVSCKQAIILLAKKEENKISLLERIILKIHLVICPPCKDYDIQDKMIRNAIKTSPLEYSLTKDEKNVIIKTVIEDNN